MDLSQIVKERDEAILSLNKEKIMSYMNKYGVKMPSNELVFWAGVHKAVLRIDSATKEQREKSAKWLLDNDSLWIIRVVTYLCRTIAPFCISTISVR